MTEVIVERPLSLYEQFFRCRSEYGFFKTFQLTATYSLPLTHQALRSAFRSLLIDYHILACNLVKKGDDDVMTPVSKIRLEDVLIIADDPKYLTDGKINELAMKYLNEFEFKLFNDKPLFKLVLFDQFTLSIVLEHALYDGVVGPYMHQEIVKYLSLGIDVNAGDELFNYSRDRSLISHSLPPPIDDFIPWDIDWSGGNPSHYGKVTPEGFERFNGRFRNSRDYSLAFKLVNFTADELALMLKTCKSHGVTLTSYLEIISILSFQPVFGDRYIVAKVAIALRKYMTKDLAPDHYKHFFDYEDYKTMGNSPSTGIGHNLAPIKSFSWDLVQEFNKNLFATANNRNILSMSTGFKNAYEESNPEQFFTKDLGGFKAETSKWSNLGFVKVPTDTEWTFKDMIFSQDVSPTTSDLMISVVSTAIGGLNLVISFIDNSFDDGDYDNFDQFIDDFKSYALKYAAE